MVTSELLPFAERLKEYVGIVVTGPANRASLLQNDSVVLKAKTTHAERSSHVCPYQLRNSGVMGRLGLDSVGSSRTRRRGVGVDDAK